MNGNCFTFVYEKLQEQGYNIPDGYKNFSYKRDKNKIINDQTDFIARGDHKGFFKSFCVEVKEPKKGDIVLSRASVGIVLSKGKQWVYSETLNKVMIRPIRDCSLIMRVTNG